MDVDDDPPVRKSVDTKMMAGLMAAVAIGSLAVTVYTLIRAPGWGKLLAVIPAANCGANAFVAVAGFREAARMAIEEVLET